MAEQKKYLDILLVDDNDQIIDLMSAFFDSLGYTYKTALSGEEALKILEDNKFKVIILDINLGYTTLNGVELCILLRNGDKDVKIYALTAYSAIFHDISPEVAGFDKAFFKPEGYRDILEMLKEDLK